MISLPTLISVNVALLATLAGGMFASKYLKKVGTLAAFTAGVLLALAFFDLLPEIFALAPEAKASLEIALLVAVSGFAILYAFDRQLLQPKKAGTNQQGGDFRPNAGLIATSEFCTHGILEGLAIGFSFQFNWSLGIVVAVGVISHDFCDGLSTVTLMLNSGNTMKASYGMLFFDAIAPVLGASLTFFVELQTYYLVFCLSFLAGGFIYLGAGNLMPSAYQQNPRLVTLLTFSAGFILIFVLARMIGI